MAAANAPQVTFKELTLDEMLADPIVRLLMQRDGVAEEDVRRLIQGPSSELMRESFFVFAVNQLTKHGISVASSPPVNHFWLGLDLS